MGRGPALGHGVIDMALPIAAILGLGGKILERVIPDPVAREEARRQLVEIENRHDLAFLEADLAVINGQIENNKLETQHGGWFKGGWRPFVGWVCGLALGYKFIFYPLAVSVIQITAYFSGATPVPLEYLPEIDWIELSTILMGMLGLSGFRTYEKRKTVA